jgi:hypothetical protein
MAAARWGALLIYALIVLETGIVIYYLVWLVSSARAVRSGGDAVDRGMVHINAAQLSKKIFYIAILWAVHKTTHEPPPWLVTLLGVGVALDLYFAGSITYLMSNLLKSRLAAAKGKVNE